MAISTTATLTKGVKDLWLEAGIHAFSERAQFLKAAQMREHPLGDQAGRGDPVQFTKWDALTGSTTPLGETTDGTPSTLAITHVPVTLKEYGDHVEVSGKLSKTSYAQPEENAAKIVGQHAADSLDLVARSVFDAQTGATWVDYAGGATSVGVITIGNELSADDFRNAVARLRTAKAPPFDTSGYYLAIIHPHVLKDLKDETGDGSWTKKELYAGETLKPLRDEVGIFENCRVVQSTTCNIQLLAGAGSTASAVSADVYATYFIGDSAMAWAHAGKVPQVQNVGPSPAIGDVYGRRSIVSWYSLCGFAALHDDALYKVYSAASLGGGT